MSRIQSDSSPVHDASGFSLNAASGCQSSSQLVSLAEHVLRCSSYQIAMCIKVVILHLHGCVATLKTSQ